MIIIFLVVASLAFEVKLTANSAACLIKELPSHSKYSGEVGTKLWRPDLKYLSVQILNSQSRYIYTNVNTNSAKFDFTTDESGPYSICASNQFGSDLDIIFQLINGFDQNKRTKDVSITLEDIKFIRGINRDTRLHEELKDVYEKVLEEKAREKIKPIEIQDICASIFIFIFLGGIFYVYVQRGKQEKYKDY